MLEENQSHPTVEEVYREVRKHFPSLAKATVYNTLDVLKKRGAIRELTIASKAARYDSNPNPHPHFLCRICGSLIDVDLPCPIRPGDKILGHKVESVQTYLYGVCSQCEEKQEKHKKNSKSRNKPRLNKRKGKG